MQGCEGNVLSKSGHTLETHYGDWMKVFGNHIFIGQLMLLFLL